MPADFKPCRAPSLAGTGAATLNDQPDRSSPSPMSLAKERFEMSKKRGLDVSSAIAEMSQLVRLAASPAIPGERPPHAIARAARRLGFERGRTESFWYGKARRVDPEELDAARRVAVERSRDLKVLRDDYRRAVEILARLETRLAVTDPDFHQPDIHALRDMADGAAGTGSAGGLIPIDREGGER
jgi:hypothetical protein